MTNAAGTLKCLGTELTEIRKERGWDRTRVVNELRAKHGIDIGHRTLASYEHASRVIPLPALIALADLYEMPPGGLLEAAIRRAGIEYRCRTCRRPT